MLRLSVATLAVVTLSLFALATNRASAHEGDGEDVAYALLSASQAGGMTTVEVQILDPLPCDGLEARGLAAERLDSTASGVIQAAGECSFEGAIELQEPGRWNLIVSLDSDGRTAEATMPVGVSDEASSFELETWFHADASDDGFLPAWLNLQALGLYAVVALSTLALVGYYLRARPREGPDRTSET